MHLNKGAFDKESICITPGQIYMPWRAETDSKYSEIYPGYSKIEATYNEATANIQQI